MRKGRPDETLHRITRLSRLADATQAPSGETATLRTSPWCPTPAGTVSACKSRNTRSRTSAERGRSNVCRKSGSISSPSAASCTKACWRMAKRSSSSAVSRLRRRSCSVSANGDVAQSMEFNRAIGAAGNQQPPGGRKGQGIGCPGVCFQSPRDLGRGRARKQEARGGQPQRGKPQAATGQRPIAIAGFRCAPPPCRYPHHCESESPRAASPTLRLQPRQFPLNGFLRSVQG